jgi:uncharacterized membrane protein
MHLTKNNLSICCLLFAFLGFLDATYLTILHYKNILPSCTLHGCESVLTSQYSSIYGVPLSLLGSIFYLAIIIFTLAILLESGRKIFAHGLFLASFAGLFVSAVLFFIQFFLIRSFCQYCLFSEAMSILIFISASLLYSKFLRT